MPAPLPTPRTVVILERQSAIAAAVSREVAGLSVAIREARSVERLMQIVDGLQTDDDAVVVADLAVNPTRLLPALARVRERLPNVRWGIIIPRNEPLREWPLREAGASRIFRGPSSPDDAARFCAEGLPPRQALNQQFADDLLTRALISGTEAT